MLPFVKVIEFAPELKLALLVAFGGRPMIGKGGASMALGALPHMSAAH